MPAATHQARPVAQPRPRVLLTSRSPRRRRLLDEHQIDYLADPPGVEDSILAPGATTPACWVAALAYLKSRAGLEVFTGKARPGDVIVGADTTCVMDGRYFGTPRDAAEARAMITAFSGTVHEVLTGVSLLDPFTRARLLLVDRATVRMGRLTEGQIDEYIATGLWAGKAGAYNLEERRAAGWPIEVAGDPTTVVGLPMGLLRRQLDRRTDPAQTPA